MCTITKIIFKKWTLIKFSLGQPKNFCVSAKILKKLRKFLLHFNYLRYKKGTQKRIRVGLGTKIFGRYDYMRSTGRTKFLLGLTI